MSEHPILFSGEMVRAILEGRKTQTRRGIKVRSEMPDPYRSAVITQGSDGWLLEKWTRCEREFDNFGRCERLACPYGQPGDWLWVRETWAMNEPPSGAIYRADAEAHNGFPAKWKPSIFMPRWASRLTLAITKIRVERVQEISHEDATAEGCRPYCVAFDKLPAQEYRELWDKINAKRGFDWDANPWVWVIEFKVLAAAGGNRQEPQK